MMPAAWAIAWPLAEPLYESSMPFGARLHLLARAGGEDKFDLSSYD